MSATMQARFEPVVGRYLNLDLLGKAHRLAERRQEIATGVRCVEIGRKWVASPGRGGTN